jgi:hypothetical protein
MILGKKITGRRIYAETPNPSGGTTIVSGDKSINVSTRGSNTDITVNVDGASVMKDPNTGTLMVNTYGTDEDISFESFEELEDIIETKFPLGSSKTRVFTLDAEITDDESRLVITKPFSKFVLNLNSYNIANNFSITSLYAGTVAIDGLYCKTFDATGCGPGTMFNFQRGQWQEPTVEFQDCTAHVSLNCAYPEQDVYDLFIINRATVYIYTNLPQPQEEWNYLTLSQGATLKIACDDEIAAPSDWTRDATCSLFINGVEIKKDVRGTR